MLAALLIAQGLPERRPEPAAAALDLGVAFTFVFRSERWVRKLLFGAVCLLFCLADRSVSAIDGLLVEVARLVRAGARELPAWDHPWQHIRDGFKFFSSCSSGQFRPSSSASRPPSSATALCRGGHLAGAVSAVGSVWSLS